MSTGDPEWGALELARLDASAAASRARESEAIERILGIQRVEARRRAYDEYDEWKSLTRAHRARESEAWVNAQKGWDHGK